MKITCDACFRGCTLEEGRTGACLARANRGGKIVCESYGQLTSIALDPIEKKPLNRFYPGSMILSVGSYGCNLKCPFCQNYEISLAGCGNAPVADVLQRECESCSPGEVCDIAKKLESRGNIGVAFTYNEPLVGYEFVRDTAKLVKSAGMKNVLVTNGCFSDQVLSEVLPYIDAMNIDLKSFSESYYRDVLKGDLSLVKAFIRKAAASCHVELTTLIIPGENDSEEEMEKISSWIAETEELCGKKIPLHITRFFPRNLYADRRPTEVESIFALSEAARRKLAFVYEGNV